MREGLRHLLELLAKCDCRKPDPCGHAQNIIMVLKQDQQKKRILVAPLNWGLGHATRCIPIINALIAEGFEPTFCRDGGAWDDFR